MVLQQLAHCKQSVRCQIWPSASCFSRSRPLRGFFSNRVRKERIRRLLRRTTCLNVRKLTVDIGANIEFYFYLRHMWEPYKKGYKAWLQLERSLSDNSVEAYVHDIEKLTEYFLQKNDLKKPNEV